MSFRAKSTFLLWLLNVYKLELQILVYWTHVEYPSKLCFDSRVDGMVLGEEINWIFDTPKIFLKPDQMPNRYYPYNNLCRVRRLCMSSSHLS